MNCVILQKVVYRLPGTKRPVYGVIVGEGENGTAILFIKKPNGVASHSLVFAVDSGRGYYETAKTSECQIDVTSIAALGLKLQAVAGGLEEQEVEKMLEDLL